MSHFYMTENMGYVVVMLEAQLFLCKRQSLTTKVRRFLNDMALVDDSTTEDCFTDAGPAATSRVDGHF